MTTTAHLRMQALSKQRPQRIDMSQFHEHIGDDFPVVTPDKIGKFRLQQYLRMKLGANYRNHPMGKRALQHFESTSKAIAVTARGAGNAS